MDHSRRSATFDTTSPIVASSFATLSTRPAFVGDKADYLASFMDARSAVRTTARSRSEMAATFQPHKHLLRQVALAIRDGPAFI